MPIREINQAQETLKAHLNGGKERLAGAIGSAMHEFVEMLEKSGYEIKKQSFEARNQVNKYVKSNPFKSLGIAAITGAVIALLLRR